MIVERKLLTLDQAAISEGGELSGYANVFGLVDHGGDRVMPGAFAKAIPEFLSDGFLAWGHDWMDPVAMPVEAREDDHGLFIRGIFHSTPGAQEKRTIASERLAKGLSMGLSIGYGVEDERQAGEVRELHVIYPLFETSLVMVPMNAASRITAIKGGSPADRLPYAEHLDLVTDEVKALLARSRSRADARAKARRVLSAPNRTRLGAIAGTLRETAADLDTLLADTEPESERLARELDGIRARAALLGIRI